MYRTPHARLRTLIAWGLSFVLILCFAAMPLGAIAEELTDAGERQYELKGQDEQTTVTATTQTDWISQYGNTVLSVPAEQLTAIFDYGDVLSVSFLNQTLQLPFCTSYSDVDSECAGIFERSGYILLAINTGDFATTFGIATKTANPDGTISWNYPEGVTGPVEFVITLAEKGGYYEEYVMRHLSHTNNRDDYPQLSDDEFSNFREVATTGMGRGVLYRSATPVDPSRNRNSYADAAARNAGITLAINMADAEADLAGFPGYDQTYYATTSHIALKMGLDITTDDYREKLARGFRTMAEQPGIYLVHCLEGKDRTGFAIAILECLMGATLDEVIDDYMLSYYNYYGVTAEEPRYQVIAQGNIIKSLQRVYGLESLYGVDLATEAHEYLLGLGLNENEIAALKRNLCPPRMIRVSFDMHEHGKAHDTQTIEEGQCARRPDDDPVADGFTFDGWFADTECTTPFDFSAPLFADTVIHAKWTQVEASYEHKASSVAKPTESATGVSKLPKTSDPYGGAITYALMFTASLSLMLSVALRCANKIRATQGPAQH